MRLPDEFILQTREAMGDELFALYRNAVEQEPPVSVRLNPRKPTDVTLSDVVPWCSRGYYLSSRPVFTFDPLFHGGCYYVQEAASMFVSRALSTFINDPVVVLDLCAAPGGKSTAALPVLPEGSVLISNDVVPQRAQVLYENMQKWGWSNTIVTSVATSVYAQLTALADVVLCDVPCSGEGMFRKDPVAVAEWSRQNVAKCQSLQRSILRDAWRCLRPGGILIYSTCTLNTLENEANVGWLCNETDASLLAVPVDDGWGITGSLLAASSGGTDGPVYRFLPGMTRGEGLFMAVVRKGDKQVEEQCARNVKPQKISWLSNDKVSPRHWLASPASFSFCLSPDKQEIWAVPAYMSNLLTAVWRLSPLSAGVKMAAVRGKELLPDASLALSVELDEGAFPRAELSYGQAIAYLQRAAVVLPDGVPHGHILVTFRGVPLGFVNNIGSRANNLYPKEWRIRTTHIVDKYEDPLNKTITR